MYYYFFDHERCVAKCNYQPVDTGYMESETDYDIATLRLIDGQLTVVTPPEPTEEEEPRIIEKEQLGTTTEKLFMAVAGLYELISEMGGGESNGDS